MIPPVAAALGAHCPWHQPPLPPPHTTTWSRRLGDVDADVDAVFSEYVAALHSHARSMLCTAPAATAGAGAGQHDGSSSGGGGAAPLGPHPATFGLVPVAQLGLGEPPTPHPPGGSPAGGSAALPGWAMWPPSAALLGAPAAAAPAFGARLAGAGAGLQPPASWAAAAAPAFGARLAGAGACLQPPAPWAAMPMQHGE